MAPRVRVKRIEFHEEDLKTDSGIRRELRERADEAADEARSNAPVESGRYRDSIEVVVSGVTVRLQTTSRIGHLIEWGSVHNASHATLRNAAAAVASRLDED